MFVFQILPYLNFIKFISTELLSYLALNPLLSLLPPNSVVIVAPFPQGVNEYLNLVAFIDLLHQSLPEVGSFRFHLLLWESLEEYRVHGGVGD